MKKRTTTTIFLIVALVLVAMTAIGAHATTGQAFNNHSNFNFVVAYVPGQTLRFSVFNPNTPEQGSEGVGARAYIYDATGRLLAQSQETAIVAGQFHSFDFNRDAISAEGEPGTRRLQVRGTIQVSLGDGSVRNLSQSVSISIEVVENSTGKTVGGPYFTGSVTVSED